MSMDDRVPPSPHVFRLDRPPSRMVTEDVLVWDERDAWCNISEWPTRSWHTFFFVPSFAKNAYAPTRILCLLLDSGWKVASCSVVKHGFLWLKETRVWAMTRHVDWVRDGSETSFVGHRVTPSMFADKGEPR